MYFFVKKQANRGTPVRVSPGRRENQHGEGGKTVIIAGAGGMDRSELKEHIARINEKTGRKHDAAEFSDQLQQRAHNEYGKRPSLKRKMETGKWT